MEWQDAGHRGDGPASSTGSGASCSRSRRASPSRLPADGSSLARKAHQTIAKVTDDIDRRFPFNTPIAAVMELVNEIYRVKDDPAARASALRGRDGVSLIQPYAPHVAEELWERLGHERLWEEPWPEADPALLEERHLRARRPGERQGARPAPGPGGHAGGRAGRARARVGARAARTWTASRGGRSSSRASSSTSSSRARRRAAPAVGGDRHGSARFGTTIRGRLLAHRRTVARARHTRDGLAATLRR